MQNGGSRWKSIVFDTLPPIRRIPPATHVRHDFPCLVIANLRFSSDVGAPLTRSLRFPVRDPDMASTRARRPLKRPVDASLPTAGEKAGGMAHKFAGTVANCRQPARLTEADRAPGGTS